MGRRSRGFTLLEVMIVVVIVGILAAIALPAYQSQVRKGNRSAAQQFMQDVAVLQQQIMLDSRNYVAVTATSYFANRPSDGSNPGVGKAAPDTTTGKYDFTVTVNNAATPPTFTITATALGGQDKDPNLHSLTLDQAGNRKTFNSGGTQTGTW
jgi:type IV pilus assembly protein PilE